MELRTLSVSWRVAMVACAMVLASCGKESPATLIGSAKESIVKRDYKAAAIHLKNALNANPDSPEARYLLGKVLLENGELANAEVELRRARELKHSSDEVTPALLRTYLLLRQFDKVVEEGQRAPVLGRQPKAETLTFLAAAYLAKGDRAAAEKAIAEALVADPESASARTAQARLKILDKDLSGALSLVEQVVAKWPLETDALKLQGDLLATTGKRDLALASYRKALAVRPDYLAARNAIFVVLFEQAKYDPKAKEFASAIEELDAMRKIAPGSFVTVMADAQVAYAKRDFKSARDHVQKMLRIAPDALFALQLAGAVDYNLGVFAQAESNLNKALKIDSKSVFSRYWLTMVHLARGQPAKAMESLAPAIAEGTGDASLLFLAGQVYLQSGEFKKAEEFLKKANAIEPGNAGTRTALALSRLRGGDSENAFADLEQISAADQGTVADWALISSRIATGNLDRALKGVEALEKKQPNSAVVADLRGVVLMRKNDAAGARQSFESALRLNPTFLVSATRLAALDLADKKPDAAVKRLESVIAADPGNPAPLLALARIKSEMSAGEEDVLALIKKAVAASSVDPAPRLALVEHYLRIRDFKNASAAATQAVSAIPDNPDLLSALGTAQVAAGETNQAIKTYSRIAELRPESIDSYLLVSSIHARTNNLEAAAQSLQRGLLISKDSLLLKQSLVNVDVARGKFDEALALAREIQRQLPKGRVGFALEGDVQLAKGKLIEAAAAYRAGLKLESSTETAIKLVSVLRAAETQGDATKFEADWLKDNPKDAAFRRFLAEAAIGSRQFARAQELLRQVLVLRPDNPAILNNLAYVTAELRQPGALAYAEKAHKLAPNQPAIMDTLGVLLADNGELPRALELLAKASAADPQSTEIKFNYARVLVKAGKKADAKAVLEDLAKQGSKFKSQDEVTKLLREVS